MRNTSAKYNESVFQIKVKDINPNLDKNKKAACECDNDHVKLIIRRGALNAMLPRRKSKLMDD